MVDYDPRPTTSVINERDAIIERQREHLHDIDLWAKRLKGPCLACRWRSGGGGYEHCNNPAVTKAKPDPVDGTITWVAPRCREERKVMYSSDPYNGDERWVGHTLCGPEGLLFEPRTFNQFFVKWALNGLWLVPLCILGSCVIVNS